MKKKAKVVISELKVKSFITSIDSGQQQTYKGGFDGRTLAACDTVLNSICRTCQFVCH
jgi:hypothetical protein